MQIFAFFSSSFNWPCLSGPDEINSQINIKQHLDENEKTEHQRRGLNNHSRKEHPETQWSLRVLCAVSMKSLMALFHQTAAWKIIFWLKFSYFSHPGSHFTFCSWRKQTCMIKNKKNFFQETMKYQKVVWKCTTHEICKGLGAEERSERRARKQQNLPSKTFSFISFQWLFRSAHSSWNFSSCPREKKKHRSFELKCSFDGMQVGRSLRWPAQVSIDETQRERELEDFCGNILTLIWQANISLWIVVEIGY